MKANQIMKIFKETAYVRMGGSAEELRTAEYIREQVRTLGLEAELQSFEVDMADIQEAVFLADGVEIPCKGYR